MRLPKLSYRLDFAFSPHLRSFVVQIKLNVDRQLNYFCLKGHRSLAVLLLCFLTITLPCSCRGNRTHGPESPSLICTCAPSATTVSAF